MQRIFALDEPQPHMEPVVVEDGPHEDGSHEDRSGEEFELVMGRRQIAALTFLALVMVAVCSGASYLVGKALAGRAMTTLEEPAQPLINLEQPPAPLPAEMLEATAPIASALIGPPAAPVHAPEAPLFASTVPKAIYIQVGAVEKGVATVIAEGLRKHALNSFVAPGPNEKVFRVLIGPFPDAEGYQKARNIVDQIGLASFARQYQQQ